MNHALAPIMLKLPSINPPLKLMLHDDSDQIISARLREQGVWEEYETELSLKLLKPGDCYVDVGANIGYYSLIASRCVGAKGQVISFEPDAKNFALLEQNIALNAGDNIQAFNAALSDANREGRLYLSSDNFGDHRIYPSPGQRPQQTIQLVHGGQHLAKLCQRVDFIKIDTQGAEFFVLNGLMDVILQNNAHLQMIVELCPYGIRQSGSHGLELLGLLDNTGMQYHIIDHIGHALIPAQSDDLASWIKSLDDAPENEGFINLLVSPKHFDLAAVTRIVPADKNR